MSQYKRLPTKKQKPSTDEILTFAERIYHWFNLNWKWIAASIAAVAVLVAAILLISHFMEKRDDGAKDIYFSALRLAEGSEAALLEFQKVVDKYPSSGVAELAGLKISDIWYTRGDYKRSEAALEKALKSSDPVVKGLAFNNLAACKLAQNEPLKAADEYLKAFNDKKNPNRGTAYFNAGLAYEQAKDLEKAKKIFAELSKEETEFSTPELREKSKERLIWIAVQAD